MIRFSESWIGQPFYAHGKYWTRWDTEAASTMHGSQTHGSACNFMIDAPDGDKTKGEWVEEVICELDA